MAPPERRPSPPVQLRVLLADAKRAGVPFDDAWPAALRAVRWPHDTTHRRQWRDAAHKTRAEWQAAYEDRPTSSGGVLATLREADLGREAEETGGERALA